MEPSRLLKSTATISKTCKTVQDQFQVAVSDSLLLLNDVYEQVAIFTCHWKDDDTKGSEDCAEFMETMLKLPASSERLSKSFVIEAKRESLDIVNAVANLRKTLDRERRTLFIFHTLATLPQDRVLTN